VLAGLINAFTPLATVIVAVFILRQEPYSSTVIGGLVVGLIGVVVVIGAWNGFGKSQLLALAHASLPSYVTASFLVRPWPPRQVARQAGRLGHGSGPVRDPAAVALFPRVRPRPGTSPAVVAHGLGALGILGTGVAYILNFHIVRHAPQPSPAASRTSRPSSPSPSASRFSANR